VGVIVVCLVPVFWLVMVLLFGGPQRLRARASSGWPQADGRVVSSHVDDIQIARAGARVPDVRYEYQVNGVQYRGWTVQFNYSSPEPNAVVSKYPVGRHVRVSYDPSKPSRSVLEPGLDTGDVRRALMLPAYAAAVIVATGIFFFVSRALRGR
jgi:hypothetical protein